MPVTSRSWPVFDTADLITGGLKEFLIERRGEGKSYRDIAAELRELNIVVTHQSVSAWCQRLEIEDPA